MNSKQLKDLKAVLRSVELNCEVLTNIQLIVEKEHFVLESRRDDYESKGTDYWDMKAGDLDERIDALEEEVEGLDAISSSIQNLVSLMRTTIGEIEGRSLQLDMPKSPGTNISLQKLVSKYDPLFEEIARLIVTTNTVSSSSLQRRYTIGYNRAGKIIDELEAAGIIGPENGGKPRPVLVDAIELEQILACISN